MKDDISRLNKKWDIIKGGAIDLEPRIKYDYRENSPGPGRYDPDIRAIKPKNFKYVIGEKLESNALKIFTGTDKIVGPGKYDVNNFTSKHRKFPKWSMGKAEKKGLFNKTFTKNETYEVYSSIGDQIRTHKKSEAKIHIGNSTRDMEALRGFFPNTMSRSPSMFCIRLPKI